ncbi:beta-microseminoprotein-like [Parambassis ranga]|uniref:Beta-microseminoprotein-like n=1 Tax=Parambassis ranga TaxID=210632 RepID=A0A6P7JT59_9TELE|nr:beta-microseminoprotein [Parambassis ranga]
MGSFHVFVCFMGLVALCHSDCSFQKLMVEDLDNPPKGCVDNDGKLHDFGSEWEKDCVACSCTAEGLSCCSRIPDADTVDIPEECELVVNKETCSAQVVMKSDKTKECSPL